MTIPGWLKPLLIKGAAVLAIVFGAVAVWNHQHRALTDARRALEASELERKGLIVAHEKTVSGLNAKIAEMAKDPRLAAALAEARAAAPGAKPVQAATFSTGAVVVTATPEKATAPAGAVGPDREALSPTPPTEGQAVARSDAPAQPSLPSSCVLANGDQASISVDAVTFQTRLGNTFIVGVATAWRETPAPRTQLFGGKFQSALSDVSGLAPPSLPRWGPGVSAACFSAGCSAGPALGFPPLRFTVFGHAVEIDASAGLLLGGLGVGVTSTAIGRF